ncbi:maleylpyruvate isomerase family mycothiol-dependent enzyme [Streptomyces sp. NPDC004610]|uniref:maleylpyruvate isomerase family mycothiol-dependent enzyme n=1 Tax=unclassified Streptomyces TaxID=2593676 RepID=UPI0033B08DF2
MTDKGVQGVHGGAGAAGVERDPEVPGRLLAVERDALVPLLRGRADSDFEILTEACPEWTVRDVLAHCASVLSRVVESRYEKGVFSPSANQRDIEALSQLSPQGIVDELERGMSEAGPIIAKAGGILDGIGLGEWVHAGDVREALGEPGAYGGAGLPDALTLLAQISREKGKVALHADLDDRDEPVLLGEPDGQRPPARFLGDAPTLVRLYSGRSVRGAEFELVGVTAGELNIYA